jgi:hypothetical protein
MGSWLLLERRGRGREVEGTFVVFAGSWRRRREVAKVREELSLRVLLRLKKMLLYRRREDMVNKESRRVVGTWGGVGGHFAAVAQSSRFCFRGGSPASHQHSRVSSKHFISLLTIFT